MRIQHNIPAMSAYRNYTHNVSSVQKNLEKLSSGYRINRAGDDAAGLAISEKMRAQISGLEQAQSNAKSGINLVQTAEGALTEVHDMLNRMYTLAEQSANGTYDDDVDRKQLQKEVESLRNEIDRIADSTNYNGINLLDGTKAQTAAVAATTEVGELTNVSVTAVADGNFPTEKTTKGEYSIDLKDFTGVVSAASNAAGTVTIKIGSVTIAEASTTGGLSVTAGDFKLSAAVSGAGTAGVTLSSGGVNYTFSIDGDKITFKMVADPTKEADTKEDMTVSVSGAKASTPGGEQGNQAHPLSVKIETPAVYAGERVYAHAKFDLASAFTSGIKDGDVLKIGDDTYTFAVGADSKFKDAANVVDLTDLTADDTTTGAITDTDKLAKAARKLTVAAAGNKQFKVTNDNSSTEIDLVEKEGGFDDYKTYNLGGASATDKTDGEWYKVENGVTVNLVQTGTAEAVAEQKATGGLTLQIGDTADDFNKLTVSIKNMHAYAMKFTEDDLGANATAQQKAVAAEGLSIEDINISTQEGASKAMAVIKNAVNYVSDVRGDLGALQNRLDHTINNLSVTQENIQDAESTIRDVDIAKEMMAYTKNNILVQSAQAMLAQANQLPQGVLQLLG